MQHRIEHFYYPKCLVRQHWKAGLDLHWASNFLGTFPTWKVLPSWGRCQFKNLVNILGNIKRLSEVTIYSASKLHYHSLSKEWKLHILPSWPTSPLPCFGSEGAGKSTKKGGMKIQHFSGVSQTFRALFKIPSLFWPSTSQSLQSQMA